MRAQILSVAVWSLIAWCSASVAQTQRGRLALNGEWEAVTTDRAAQSPPSEGWQKKTVPGVEHGLARGGSQWTWYRRRVEIPAEWAGKRLFLVLGGARYDAHVWWDGKLLGHRLEGWTPWELELPAGIGAHTLVVRCQDWSATFAPGVSIPADAPGGTDLRYIGGGKVIAPIGGHFGFYGLWDEAWLEARPQTHLIDVAVDTSHRRQEIAISGGVDGETDSAGVSGEVLDGDRVVVRLPAARVTGERWRLAAPATGVRWWSPEEPKLYRLRIRLLAAGQPLDVLEMRIGFRELRAEGQDFYLNGVKRHLLATSTWPSPTPQTRAEVRANLEKIKSGNNVAFRLHTQPWQHVWLEEADEVGLMIVEEGALWCDGRGTYAYKSDQFWNNVREHLAGMVRRDRNHASLVMWSLENEILHCGAARYSPDVEAKLAAAGRFVKRIDPVHLITYEADHDPGGVADVIGLHYPHEMPAHTDYPNTADWLAQTVVTGTGGDLLGSRRKAFHWDRKKPLYIGEFLWVPAGNFAPGTVFFGDEAYLDRRRYNERAKGESWRHQILAYRRAGVSGMCPWTAIASGGGVGSELWFEVERQMYESVAAFVREADTRFFSGEEVTRTFDLFNDSPRPQHLQLRWQLGGGEPGNRDLRLAPAESTAVTVHLQAPKVRTARPVDLQWKLSADGKSVHEGAQRWQVAPKTRLAAPADVGLVVFDPDGRWSRELQTEGLMHRTIDSLADLSAVDSARSVLVIAPRAFRSRPSPGGLPQVGAPQPGEKALVQFLRDGGKALVLEQDTYQGAPLGLTLVDHASTITFPQHPRHPALAGLTNDDFRFWRGDHYVSRREFRRPTAGGILPLVVSGGQRGIDQTAVVEVPAGRGTVIACQALVGEKLASEPAARRFFQQALDYLAAAPPRAQGALLITDSDAFAERLRGLRVAARRADSVPAGIDATQTPVVLLHGGGETIERSAAALREFLASSPAATVYWHAPDFDAFSDWCASAGIENAALSRANGPVRVRDSGHWLFSGLCREDLAFAGTSAGRSWRNPFTYDPSVIDRAIMPAASGRQVRFEAESMKLSGRYVDVSADGKSVAFATVGTGDFRFDAPRAGLYAVTVHAWGSPAAGEYPLAVLRREGQAVAAVTVDSREPRGFHTVADLPAGSAQMTIAYVNDRQAGGEDRNLYLDAVEISAQPLPAASADLVTLPGALAVIRAGQGRLVVDGVRWDETRRNETKARRYASALLSKLGAPFVPPAPEPWWLLPSAFREVGKAPYFNATPSQLAFASHAVVQAEFECVTAGRYRVVLRGWSTPAGDEYAKAQVKVDDQVTGEVELASASVAVYAVGTTQRLETGRHTVTVEFINDVVLDGEDRNLYLNAVGFAEEG